MKAPDHPVPSGDRQMARLLLEALAEAGLAPALACRLRAYDRGEPARQMRLDRLAARAAPLIARRWQGRLDTWFTYHCYHKAPDGLGPRVARALDRPYVLAEASIAPRRAEGPWAEGYRLAAKAITAADVVVAMSAVDEVALAGTVRPPARLVRLPPFTRAPERQPLPAKPATSPRLVTVAMMRPGAKLRSFRLLAQALSELTDRPWTLDVVGDGDARAEVEAALAPLGPGRVRLHGRIDDAGVRDALVAGASAFVWPAVDEAYGMALLEAQALGVPVVAGNGHGVPEIVATGETGLLVAVGEVRAFRDAIAALLDDPVRAAAMGGCAAARVRRRHGLAAASRHLADIVAQAAAVHRLRRR